MFDIGFSELFLLAVVGLLVLGPERLPQVARTLGALMRKARSSWAQLQHTIDQELKASELKAPLDSAREDLERAARDINDAAAGRPADKPPDGSTGNG